MKSRKCQSNLGALALLDFVITLGILDEKQLACADVLRARFGWEK